MTAIENKMNRKARRSRRHISEMHLGVKGRYKARAVRADNSVREESEWSDNLIVAVGLNWLMGQANNSSTVPLRGVAGSGNATPTMADTNLQSPLGSGVNNIQSDVATWNTTTSPYYGRRTITFRSAQGGVVGNVSEVGVTVNGILLSRALVVDSNGNPTTVTILSDEFLDIVWEFSVYFTASSGTFTMVIDGVTTNFTYNITPANMTVTPINGGWNWFEVSSPGQIRALIPWSGSSAQQALETQTLGQINSKPAGSQVGPDNSVTAAAYVSNSFQRDFTLLWGLNSANYATGIGSFFISFTAAAYQMSISPKVLKVATKSFSHTFRITIANA